MNVAPYAKAVTSAVIAALTALGTALLDQHVTTGEWVAVASAFFAALSLTYSVPNKAQARRGLAGELGVTNIGVALIVLIVVLALFLGFGISHFFLLLLLLIVLVVLL